MNREYSVLKIPRHEDPSEELVLLEGEHRRSTDELQAHLQQLRSSEGGLEEVAEASGLIGFIRFLQGYYLILITRHKKVGKIGHHYVLAIEKTYLLPLFVESTKLYRDEKSLRDQFNALNLSKDFYFSYTYELSRTVQMNLADAARAAAGEKRRPLLTETDSSKHHRFVWNHFHMGPLLKKEGWQHWCLSIIHGFFAYTKCSSFGWTFEIALIARRSRFFAGTRYRKRGLNVDGHVGNDVETEQLLCDASTRHLSRGHVMSFVQIRGSVPLFWSQEATAINPKPPVMYPRCDPTLSATRLHFADLLTRYGTPQLVVNLMKAKKLDSHEVRLSKHFESAIERMNRELPPKLRILYRPFDMKNHAKSSPIYEVFARLAESVVVRVGFFHTSNGLLQKPERVQSGVVRTNCVDCLDRTNVLQFFVGLEVLKQQLTALNLLPEPRLDFDSQVVAVLSELYDLMGDHLALQYAGSVAHKKYQLLGSRPRMMTSSKELLTSIHRHYNNSFTDSEKQASLNLFLGIYQPRGHPRLYELDCDSWVHHRRLNDDYNPGEWWVNPLRRYDDKMRPLLPAHDDKMGPLLQALEIPMVPGHADGDAWFREIHTVWKLTWFEKLLSSLEETSVQINRQTRKLSTLRPYKAITQRRQELSDSAVGEDVNSASYASGQDALFLLSPCQVPRAVDPNDLQSYQVYADSRRLSRYIWESGPKDVGNVILDSTMTIFPLARPEASGRSLMDIFQGFDWRAELSEEAEDTRDDSVAFMRWFFSKYLSHHLEKKPKQKAERRGAITDAGGTQLSLQTAMDTPVSAETPAATGQHTTQPGYPLLRARKAPERLRRCAYCDEAYDAAEDEAYVDFAEARAQSSRRDLGAWNMSMPLCARHRDRRDEIQKYGQREGFEVEPSGATEDTSDKPIKICVRTRNPNLKPWEGWLQVNYQPARQSRRDSTITRLRTQSQTTCLTEGSRTPWEENAAAATNGATGVAASLSTANLVKGAAQQLENNSGERWRHLWTYAFPYMPPPPPDLNEELGVPDWWLSTLEPTAPAQPAPEPATVFRRAGHARGRRHARHVAVNDQHRRDSVGSGVHAVELVHGLSVVTSKAVPTKGPAAPKGKRSIFHGVNLAQVLEELTSGSPKIKIHSHRRTSSNQT